MQFKYLTWILLYNLKAANRRTKWRNRESCTAIFKFIQYRNQSNRCIRSFLISISSCWTFKSFKSIFITFEAYFADRIYIILNHFIKYLKPFATYCYSMGEFSLWNLNFNFFVICNTFWNFCILYVFCKLYWNCHIFSSKLDFLGNLNGYCISKTCQKIVTIM